MYKVINNIIRNFFNSNLRGLFKNIFSFITKRPIFISQGTKKETFQKEVWYFNSSSHLDFSSIFSEIGKLLLDKLEMEGLTVSALLCTGGPSYCQTGTSINNPNHFMPCYSCVKFNKNLLLDNETIEFSKKIEITNKKRSLSDEEILELLKPSLNWLLRGNHENEIRKEALRKNLYSAAIKWDHFLSDIDNNLLPKICLIFNGYTFPEVIVKKILDKRGVKTITFEQGMLEDSIFFTEGFAPDYNFEPRVNNLNKNEMAILENYITRRSKGEFNRAGIEFWNKITSVSLPLSKKIKEYKKTVSIFLNVPFDSSQVKANTLFNDIYDWLIETKKLIEENSDILFVYRSHPDESRNDKKLYKSTEKWLIENNFSAFDNVEIISSENKLNSYELIESSDLVLVYNSTLALESVLIGKNVLVGGNVHYSRINYFKVASTKKDYHKKFSSMINNEFSFNEKDLKEVQRYFYSFTFESSINFNNEIEKNNLRKYSFSIKKDADLNSASLNEFINYIYSLD